MNPSAPGGVLLSQMECPESLEAEFHHWYNMEHIPERMRVPGFLGAARYEAVDGGPRFLARYDMKDLEALAHPDYLRVKENPSEETRKILAAVTLFTRYAARLFSCRRREDAPPDAGGAPYLLLAGFPVPSEAEADFDAWYEEEHTDRLLSIPGWRRCIRLKVVSGEPEPWTDIALHEVSGLDVLEAPERIESRETPWSRRLRGRAWFRKGSLIVYRKFADF